MSTAATAPSFAKVQLSRRGRERFQPAGMSTERALEIAIAVLDLHGRFPSSQPLEELVAHSGRVREPGA